uniref:ShKT domain-containing protein n=1 Tax=Heterorhabditis bacteriophora TaxID=37862 RepID=A0A1I7WLC4_HETBA
MSGFYWITYVLSMITIILIFTSIVHTRTAPPNIYRWISDNSYIFQFEDGKLLTFLDEKDGLSCTECIGIASGLIPKVACAVMHPSNQQEPKFGCFQGFFKILIFPFTLSNNKMLIIAILVPHICIEEFTLRYSNFFHSSRREISQDPALLNREEISSSPERNGFLDINPVIDLTQDNTKISLPNDVLDQLKKSSSQDRELLLSDLERKINIQVDQAKFFKNRKFKDEVETQISTSKVKVARDSIDGFEDITDPSMMNHEDISTLLFEDNNTPLPTELFIKSLEPESLINEENSQLIPDELSLKKELSNPSANNTSIKKDFVEKRKVSEITDDKMNIVVNKRRKLPSFFGTTTKATTTTTLPTTTTPKKCEDTHALCCFWAIAGECESNPFWMRINCAKTCGTCSCPLRNADECVSRGINCTLPTSTVRIITSSTSLSPLLRLSSVSDRPTSKTKPRPTRPFTPPLNGFRRTQSTARTVSKKIFDTTSTTKPMTSTPISSTTTTTSTVSTTTTTTTTLDPCQDLNPHCPFWASLGECEMYCFIIYFLV